VDFFRLCLSDVSFEEVGFAYHSAYSKRETAAQLAQSGDIECLYKFARSSSALLCIF
jgi:hypothetical protein